ncbi:serine--tRNA ligase [Urbifossiella limnaea]|uniref:Serine--tRNA ligase n=1 Tax=Urbifossiella limnaea TaxID=2528023 RepID=A0A517XS58_9BACT|nr:serine--tRNA ligase [Urbifossiella limnaea]QDU20345.1 Serine--tRNA ligase [Urbifossiella limnaea]
MLDAAFVRDHLAAVKANCANRNVSADAADRAVAADDERKRLVKLRDETSAKANANSKLFGAAKTPEEKDAVRQQGAALKEEVARLEVQLKGVEEELKTHLLQLPNMTHPAAPVGTDSAANVVVAEFGKKPAFDFAPKDHVALCESLDLADFEAGTRVAGQKFYFLKNEAALLEIALVQYAVQACVKAGFTPVITPDLARVEVLEGIGFQPRDNAETRQVYTVADTDLCLIATAEITLGGMHKDRIFDEAELPKRYVGLSHCFRTEAGAAGRDTRGLYRVHQFTKVEMFAFCTPENSDAIHEEIRTLEEQIFTGLGLHFHVIDTCTGDLGGPAYRKYDLEAWMPGRGAGGDFGEITSTSNCTDFQARRLGIRYKGKGFKGTRFVHTLNGTAVACTRALVAILESYQQADGSVVIPDALRPWVGKDVIAARK